MKLSSAIFLLIGSAFPLVAQPALADPDEVAVLLSLIESSKKTLEEQQKLLKLFIEYKKTREAFIEDPTSARLATMLVKISARVYDEIEKNHLSHLFSADFISELRFFAQVGQQQGISKPKV